MRVLILIIGFAYCFLFLACGNKASLKSEDVVQPLASKITHDFFEHGNHRYDDYFWLSNPKDTAVLALLDAENTYTEKVLAHTKKLQDKLFKEITSRQELQKEDLPIKKNGYWLYRRFEKDKAFPLICRKKDTWAGKEEVIISVPELAKNINHFEIADVSISPDNNLVAYLVDTTGERRHTLYIKNLITGLLLSEKIDNTSSDALEWSSDSKQLFYVSVDETVRGYKVMKHVLGNDSRLDKLIYEEKDKSFVVSVSKSWSQQYIFIGSYSNTTYEFRYLNVNNLDGKPQLIQQRQRGLIYVANHYEGNEFYIQNNDNAKNFKLSIAPLSNPSIANWEDIITRSDSSFLEDYVVLKNYIIIQDKVKGLNKIRILNREDNSMQEIDLGDEAYVANMSIADYDNFAIDSLRFSYQSLSTPPSIFNYDIKTRTKTILQQENVAGYNISKYESKRIWIKARDSVQIPISIVYRKDLFMNDGSNPLLLYAYGSYGISMDPNFQPDLLSLLDRGFVYCIAHVRGGQELGRKWYEDGKLSKKKNSFNDYIDCAEYLINKKYTAKDRQFGFGTSAGGMLIAAALNQRPDLFKGIVAELPWTDVLSDMLDETLPLTTLEYDEWGNPTKKEDYEYMLSWSPYDNVKPANYPSVLAFANLNDSQVPFYSPTKWVQKLRVNNMGKNPIMLHCDKTARISSGAGRFEQSKITALQYAFLLDLVGKTE